MTNAKPTGKGAGETTRKVADKRRIELLEQQLAIFAQEFHDRIDAVDDLRHEISSVRTIVRDQLAELRDVYLMHKRHLEETIEMIDLFRSIFSQLEVQLSKGGIVLTSGAATSWYQGFRRAHTKATRTVLRQKQELAPYLAEDWKPPEMNTWAGQLAKLADGNVEPSQPTQGTRPKRPASSASSSGPGENRD